MFLPSTANSIYAPGTTVDIFATHGFPLLLCLSIGTGALLFSFIADKKDSFFFFLLCALIVVFSGLAALFNLTGLFFANDHNSSVAQLQNIAVEQDTQVEEISNYIEEEYEFTPTEDLIFTLLGDTALSDYDNGKGEGLIWRGEPTEYLIENTVYILQLAWAGDRWMLLDVTEGETTQLNELDLTAEPSE